MFSGRPRSGFTRVKAFFAEDRAPDFWLKGHVVMLTAMIADDLETLRRIFRCGCLFRTAFRAALRGHHITLVEHLLFFFGKKKDLLTLNTRDFNIRHRSSSFLFRFLWGVADSVAQTAMNSIMKILRRAQCFDVTFHGFSKRIEIVSALERRHDPSAANLIGPFFQRAGHRDIIGVLKA